jgi:hypothetical protein
MNQRCGELASWRTWRVGVVDAARIARLRSASVGWKAVARELDCDVGTVLRVV